MSKESLNQGRVNFNPASSTLSRRRLLGGAIGFSAGLFIGSEKITQTRFENNNSMHELIADGDELPQSNIHNGDFFSGTPKSSQFQENSNNVAEYKVFAPGAARTDRKYNVEVPPTFKWERGELLFGATAGFQKLREGGQVAVYIPPGLSHKITPEAIEAWNRLGIEMRGIPYMMLTSDQASSDIEIRAAEATWVQPFNEKGNHDARSPFKKSVIHVHPESINDFVLKHEMGHAAFGFVDFLSRNGYKAFQNGTLKGYINPQNGEDPDKPYVGVMNYAYWLNSDKWFGMDDKYALITAGYGEL